MSSDKKNILAVGAHPDDVEMMCAGDRGCSHTSPWESPRLPPRYRCSSGHTAARRRAPETAPASAAARDRITPPCAPRCEIAGMPGGSVALVQQTFATRKRRARRPGADWRSGRLPRRPLRDQWTCFTVFISATHLSTCANTLLPGETSLSNPIEESGSPSL